MNRVIVFLAGTLTLGTTAIGSYYCFVDNPSCTIEIVRYEGSNDVFVRGCPSNYCLPEACQLEDNDTYCECSDGTQNADCKGSMTYNADGETVDSIHCTPISCSTGCHTAAWLPPPGAYYVCTCQ